MKTTPNWDSSSDQFSRQVEALHSRIQRLSQSAAENHPEQADLTSQLYEEIQTMLEELKIADEELHQQNEELASAQYALLVEKQRYQDLFELAPDGYLVTDENGLILEANQAALALLNNEFRFLSQKPLASFVDIHDRRNFRQKIAQLKSDSPGSPDRISDWVILLKPKRSEPIFVSVSVAAVRADKNFPDSENRLRWTLRDVSHRMDIEKELKELRSKLVESGEYERQQLGRELHDGPMQDLYGVIFQLKSVDQTAVGEHSKAAIEKVRNQLDQVIGSLRSICYELRPPVLIPFGLQKSILSHAENFQGEHPELQVKLHLMPDGLSIPDEVRSALFRIYKIAMTNVMRHARASQVQISLSLTEEKLVLEIRDDGVGFVPPERWIDQVRKGHFGLANATQLAEAIRGKLEVISNLNEGTLVRVVLDQEDDGD